ncbi:MAG TPA: DUF2950 domain-containing protein [Stellaceae bacterium]|nr:DUF2950 domain-containing protein [Stellaceae bacterium]
MIGSSSGNRRGRLRLRDWIVAVLVALIGIVVLSPAAAAKQMSFATPEQAVDALVAATRADSTAELLTVLGPGSRTLISSGDAVADAEARRKFVSAYETANQIMRESDDRAILAVGKDGWTFPFPIVKQGETWAFDASAGAEEILDRRIGANELSAIQVCRAYVDAQRDYAARDPEHSGLLSYAQKFKSSPGRHDGLYWPAAAGEKDSPLGPLVAQARAAGYGAKPVKGRTPYHGYYYRILTGQGPAAKGGAYSYIVKGHMIAGFALVAFPAQYGVSGVMTFIVNNDGVVYEQDLGPDTAERAETMKLFNPDSSWTPA